MSKSILISTKKLLGIDESYTAFDVDIMMHINSVFATLHQLGVGPEEGFSIESDEERWGEFTQSEMNINSVKTYVYLQVRLYFDPPTTSFALDAMNKQIEELGWRLNVQREGVKHPWVEPTPDTEPEPLMNF